MNEKLKAARVACNWTQFEVSMHLNIDFRTYGRWEQGEARPQLYNLQKLCELFGKSREELGFDITL